MSTADQHRIAATAALSRIERADSDQAATAFASAAIAAALLAIEARLGELVDAQHTATLLAGSAYGMTDPGLVHRLVSDLGDTVKATAQQARGGEDQ
ncbi:hypothetical protein [Nocardia sp. No.11]|uniref:hypothetical protein n=1 Tax=Nocardia sp. No.11 TaxID=3128861 RepID=UPI00319E5DF7